MPPVEYSIIVNEVELFRTSIRSYKEAMCNYLEVKKMDYHVRERRLKF